MKASEQQPNLDAATDGDAQLALDLAAQPRHHARCQRVVEPERVANGQALLPDPQPVAAAQTHRPQLLLHVVWTMSRTPSRAIMGWLAATNKERYTIWATDVLHDGITM